MTIIEDIAIRKILDSRGNATVEIDVLTQSGFGSAAAPSGASTGIYEVVALPKEGIDKAIEIFRLEVAPELIGFDSADQRTIDMLVKKIDGTPNYARIGGNIATALSLAVAKAAADSLGLSLYNYLGGTMANHLPKMFGNVIGGGAHAVGGTDIQEFLCVSMSPSAQQNALANAAVHKELKNMIKAKFPGMAFGKGDEGAWTISVSNEEALDMLSGACEKVSKQFGFPVRVALDLAASEFYEDGYYVYKNKPQKLTPDQQVDYVVSLIEKYNIYSVEDPFDQEDFESYVKLTQRVGKRCLIIGDDLFVTNTERIAKGIAMGAANAVLIKPNQIGSLTGTYEAVRMAHEAGYKTVVSHRSGETTDETIAHIAVGFGCHGIKTGTVGGERIAKLNELIRIEEELSIKEAADIIPSLEADKKESN